MTDINRSGKTLLVWDLPTRLFHWLLVALVALAWATGESEGRLFVVHQLAGYGVLVAILFRLFWGFVGSRHARFRDFVHAWSSVRDYTKGLLALRPRPTLGHNPLGGWMIVLLLTTLLGVSVTGLFGVEEGTRGASAYWLSPEIAQGLAELHEELVNLLLILIGIHIVGVVVDSLLTGHNLVGSMFTGRKKRDSLESSAVRANETAPGWSAALALAAATGLTWLLVG